MRLFCNAFMRTASSRIRDISSGVNSPSVRQSRPDRGEGGVLWRSGITMLMLPPPRALSPLRPGKRRLETYFFEENRVVHHAEHGLHGGHRQGVAPESGAVVARSQRGVLFFDHHRPDG